MRRSLLLSQNNPIGHRRALRVSVRLCKTHHPLPATSVGDRSSGRGRTGYVMAIGATAALPLPREGQRRSVRLLLHRRIYHRRSLAAVGFTATLGRWSSPSSHHPSLSVQRSNVPDEPRSYKRSLCMLSCESLVSKREHASADDASPGAGVGLENKGTVFPSTVPQRSRAACRTPVLRSC